jgi:hypothetical protein
MVIAGPDVSITVAFTSLWLAGSAGGPSFLQPTVRTKIKEARHNMGRKKFCFIQKSL